MAVTVDWASKVISVPQADLTHVTGTLYECDTDWLRKQLKALEASEAGMVFDDTHDHNTTYTVVGVQYARKIEIINGYSVQFVPNSQWSVRLAGSNNNLFDVENSILIQNQVQVIAQNSAGLVVVSGGGGGEADWSTSERAQIRDALGVDGSKTTATGGQLQTLDGKVVTVSGKVDTVDGKVDTVDTVVDAIQVDVDSIQADVTTIDGKADSIQSDVGTVISDVGAVDGKVDTLTSDLATTDGKVDSVQADTTELLARLSLSRAAALDNLSGIATNAALLKKIAVNRLELAAGSSSNWILYDDDDSTPLLTWDVTDASGSAVAPQAGIPARRTRGT